MNPQEKDLMYTTAGLLVSSGLQLRTQFNMEVVDNRPVPSVTFSNETYKFGTFAIKDLPNLRDFVAQKANEKNGDRVTAALNHIEKARQEAEKRFQDATFLALMPS